MKRSTKITLAIAALASSTCFLIALCSVIVAVSDYKEASVTPAPSYTMPELDNTVPPAVIGQGWNNTIVENLCLHVNQQYPGLDDVREIPLHEALTSTLEEVGIVVADDLEGCDASLLIEFEAYASYAIYQKSGKCYDGAEADGRMVLSSDGKPSISVQLNYENAPSEVINHCVKTPEAGVRNEIYHGNFGTNVIAGLYKFWGPEAAVWGINDNFLRYRVVNFIHRSDENVKAEFAPHLTLVMLYGINRDARRTALTQLGQVGSGAMDEVPVLINILEDANLQKELFDYPEGQEYRAEKEIVEVLNEITGEDFGSNVQEWVSWWDSH